MTTKLTKSQETATDVVSYLKARNPLLWIVTKEEQRVELHLYNAIKAAGMGMRTWDADIGVVRGNFNSKPMGAKTTDIGVALGLIRDAAEADPPAGPATTENQIAATGAWILRDVPPWLDGLIGIKTLRQMRNLAKMLPRATNAQAMIVISPSNKVPPELENHATVIEWPLPDREEIGVLLDSAVNALRPEQRGHVLSAEMRDPAIEAALGLSGEEVQACYARSLVQYKKIDPVAVAREKKRVVAREGVLEWYDPLPGGLGAVGGLDNMKEWLAERKLAYSPEAKQYGLRSPKGMLLVGIPGCGKSLAAKAVATAWGLPLLRVDLGGLKGKFVGESEGNLRRAIQLIETIGRCVVWIDEIEKALAGATSGSADGGVSADALGTILSWMQERKGESFVIATANDVTSLPPELMRQGRFDTIFFVDLPNKTERIEILKASLKANKQAPEVLSINLGEVADAAGGFAGVEVSELVPSAMFTAFADGGREITTADLTAVAASVTPLSKTSEARITALRTWATGRARPATKEEVVRRTARATNTSRVVELEED